VPEPTFDPASTTIANWFFNLALVSSLLQNRVFTREQANEMLDLALVHLEETQGQVMPEVRPAFAKARAMLEVLREEVVGEPDNGGLSP
jgi:hypothetical protein